MAQGSDFGSASDRVMIRAGFLVDANLLVLLIVGNVRRSLIDRHRRLKSYTVSDYDLLVSQFNPETKIFVTPNTLTETSNLLAFGSEELNYRLFAELKSMIEDSEEIVVISKLASEVPEFRWLGLTDAVLVEIASPDLPLITSDLQLWNAVASRDPGAAINFNSLRR